MLFAEDFLACPSPGELTGQSEMKRLVGGDEMKFTCYRGMGGARAVRSNCLHLSIHRLLETVW